ncbi:MAG: hypothetical protein ACI9XO_001623 [Paraglaciecola sp.]|jgi:hypothetical protein
MKQFIAIFLLLAGLYLTGFAQTIPNDRLVDWSKSGAVMSAFNDEINVLNYGLFNDGLTDNATGFEALMNQFSNQSTIFYFPTGTYKFSKTIYLQSNSLIKGASSGETIFQFDDIGNHHLIIIQGTSATEKTPVIENINKGDNYLIIENSVNFQMGDLVKISSNDSSLITSSWAVGTTGQILDIQGVDNDVLIFNQKFRKNYSLMNNPVLTIIYPIKNVGLECLKIVRTNGTANQTSNVLFKNATNCWVKGVESSYCNFAHLDIRSSSKVTVEGSYFHDAFDYGGGGKGYGVVAHLTASDCLIQNNIFENLRHSMLLQAGANGNVFAYNYSIAPYWTGTLFPDDAAGDLVLHGNYPYANLFEGNVVQNIVIDDSHGKNGPLNTFFRNRTELYGFFTSFLSPTDYLNVTGNSVLTNGVSPIFMLNGTNHFAYGNYFQNTVLPENTDNLMETSLYLTQLPPFFPENYPFTLTDNSLVNTLFSIPAKDRYLEAIKTLCGEPEPYIVSNTKLIEVNEFDINFYPVPLNNQELTIEISEEPQIERLDISVFNSLGQEVLTFTMNGNKRVIDCSTISKGIYFLRGKIEGKTIFTRQLLL